MKLTVLKKNNPGNGRGRREWTKGGGGAESEGRGGEEWGRRERKGRRKEDPEAKDKVNYIQILLIQYFSQGYRLVTLTLPYVCNRTEQIRE